MDLTPAEKIGPTLYAIYHRTCGHIAATPNERRLAEWFVNAMAAKGQHQWRIRTDVSDADLEALLRGDRCVLCRQDDPKSLEGGE